MSSAEWKLRQAERDVEVILAAASALEPKAREVFPRNVPELLSAALPSLEVRRERDLTVELIVSILDRDYGIDERHLLAEDRSKAQLGGFLYADDNRVLVFAETKYGVGFERFTVAHEGGHLVKEYLPTLADPRQTSMFESAERPRFVAHRDPPEHLLADGRSTGEAEGLTEMLLGLKAKKEAYRREVIANSVAAELLAPFREVIRVASTLAGRDRVAAVSDKFGVSKKAAAVRLAELHLLESDDRLLSLFT